MKRRLTDQEKVLVRLYEERGTPLDSFPYAPAFRDMMADMIVETGKFVEDSFPVRVSERWMWWVLVDLRKRGQLPRIRKRK